jgi:nitrate reductase gamma subunit
MMIDGLAGTERVLSFIGPVYDFLMASGDIFALVVALAIIIFLSRRLFFHISRFEGPEMNRTTHIDANIALTIILVLMVSLLTMNIGYVKHEQIAGEAVIGAYPVSSLIAGLISGSNAESFATLHEASWWLHIMLIFIFANLLPYSKHFHVFMSVPNVFLSRLDPLGKLPNMDSITREVKMMLNPDTAYAAAPADAPVERFGVKDAEDASWKNYFDSLSCTQCGRCTAVCPANITGKSFHQGK